MKNLNPSDPSFPVYQKLENHVREIKDLLNELEPTKRLTYLNELLVRLLPSRNNTKMSAQEKLKSRIREGTSSVLTLEQERMINKLTAATEELYKVSQSNKREFE